MAEAIDAPEEMSIYAPRIISIRMPVDKIGEVIGPKGKVINQIQDDTGATLSIEDDGTVYIGATNGEAAEAARNAVNAIANPTMPEVGERYLGTVVKTTNFGAFVSLLPGKDGLLHITKLRALVGGKRVENVDDVVSVGQKIQVEIAEVDDRGKLSLVPVVEESSSDAGEQPEPAAPSRPRAIRGHRVTRRVTYAGNRDDRPAARCRPVVGYPASARIVGQARRYDADPAQGGRRRRPSYDAAQRPAGHHRAGARRSARRRSGSGSASARATSPRPCTAAPTSWSTCCSRAPRSAPRSTSRSRSTRSAVSSTPSPPRSTPASTRGSSTRTSRWPSTYSAT